MMKLIYILFFITSTHLGFSQKPSEPVLNPFHPMDAVQTKIHLRDAINTFSSGLWENGDYKVFIELQAISHYIEAEYSGLIQAMQADSKMDTMSLTRYRLYAERYLKAGTQLKAAKNGVDLRQLVVYIGPDNAERNKGSSADVELFVRQSLEKGEAAVFYKGERIFTLHKRRLADYVMSNITIYYDEPSNWAFSYIGHINW